MSEENGQYESPNAEAAAWAEYESNFYGGGQSEGLKKDPSGNVYGTQSTPFPTGVGGHTVAQDIKSAYEPTSPDSSIVPSSGPVTTKKVAGLPSPTLAEPTVTTKTEPLIPGMFSNPKEAAKFNLEVLASIKDEFGRGYNPYTGYAGETQVQYNPTMAYAQPGMSFEQVIEKEGLRSLTPEWRDYFAIKAKVGTETSEERNKAGGTRAKLESLVQGQIVDYDELQAANPWMNINDVQVMQGIRSANEGYLPYAVARGEESKIKDIQKDMWEHYANWSMYQNTGGESQDKFNLRTGQGSRIPFGNVADVMGKYAASKIDVNAWKDVNQVWAGRANVQAKSAFEQAWGTQAPTTRAGIDNLVESVKAGKGQIYNGIMTDASLTQAQKDQKWAEKSQELTSTAQELRNSLTRGTVGVSEKPSFLSEGPLGSVNLAAPKQLPSVLDNIPSNSQAIQPSVSATPQSSVSQSSSLETSKNLAQLYFTVKSQGNTTEMDNIRYTANELGDVVALKLMDEIDRGNPDPLAAVLGQPSNVVTTPVVGAGVGLGLGIGQVGFGTSVKGLGFGANPQSNSLIDKIGKDWDTGIKQLTDIWNSPVKTASFNNLNSPALSNLRNQPMTFGQITGAQPISKGQSTVGETAIGAVTMLGSLPLALTGAGALAGLGIRGGIQAGLTVGSKLGQVAQGPIVANVLKTTPEMFYKGSLIKDAAVLTGTIAGTTGTTAAVGAFQPEKVVTGSTKMAEQGGLVGAFGRGVEAIQNSPIGKAQQVIESVPVIGGFAAGAREVLAPITRVSELYETQGNKAFAVLTPWVGATAINTSLTKDAMAKQGKEMSKFQEGLGYAMTALPFVAPAIFKGLGKGVEQLMRIPAVAKAAQSPATKFVNEKIIQPVGTVLSTPMQAVAPLTSKFEKALADLPGAGKVLSNEWVGITSTGGLLGRNSLFNPIPTQYRQGPGFARANMTTTGQFISSVAKDAKLAPTVTREYSFYSGRSTPVEVSGLKWKTSPLGEQFYTKKTGRGISDVTSPIGFTLQSNIGTRLRDLGSNIKSAGPGMAKSFGENLVEAAGKAYSAQGINYAVPPMFRGSVDFGRPSIQDVTLRPQPSYTPTKPNYTPVINPTRPSWTPIVRPSSPVVPSIVPPTPGVPVIRPVIIPEPIGPSRPELPYIPQRPTVTPIRPPEPLRIVPPAPDTPTPVVPDKGKVTIIVPWPNPLPKASTKTSTETDIITVPKTKTITETTTKYGTGTKDTFKAPVGSILPIFAPKGTGGGGDDSLVNQAGGIGLWKQTGMYISAPSPLPGGGIVGGWQGRRTFKYGSATPSKKAVKEYSEKKQSRIVKSRNDGNIPRQLAKLTGNRKVYAE